MWEPVCSTLASIGGKVSLVTSSLALLFLSLLGLSSLEFKGSSVAYVVYGSELLGGATILSLKSQLTFFFVPDSTICSTSLEAFSLVSSTLSRVSSSLRISISTSITSNIFLKSPYLVVLLESLKAVSTNPPVLGLFLWIGF